MNNAERLEEKALRLVDMDKIPTFKALCETKTYRTDIANELLTQLVGEILLASIVEAAPVVHGRWIQAICHVEYEDGFVDRLYECCSVCHLPNGNKQTNYCPNCGAKMDGEGEAE